MEPVTTLAPLLPSACAIALGALAPRRRTSIARLRARIADASRTDSLTGLLNRRAFEEPQLRVDPSRGYPLSQVSQGSHKVP